MRGDRPFITFLSDYGLQDEFVGVCHGVIAQRCPRARVIDLTHSIPPQDVLLGALTLRDCLRFLPIGVHLAIVDPGVGASGPQARRAIALRTAQDDRLFVGPDNGLLIPVAQACGGVLEAVDIGNSPQAREPVSVTFHGRDLFAPVAAALADGIPLASVGEPMDPGSLVSLTLPQAEIADRSLTAHVLAVDRFGNVALDATGEQLERIGAGIGTQVQIEVNAGRSPATRVRAFGDVPQGALLLYVDSRAMVALARRDGSAAQALGLARRDSVRMRLP